MNTPIQDPIAHACRLLRGAAEELKSGHTLAKTGHDWTGEPEAKAAYDEHRAVADALERWAASIGAGGVEPLRSRQCLHKISEPSASPAAPLSEQDAGLLDQGVEMLEALANDERNRGNCSSAMGAECIAHAVRRLAAALLAAERAALAAPAAVAGPSYPSITLDFKQATELLEMFGGEPGLVTLQMGCEKSHSGTGLYAYYSELPEEGAEFLGAEPDDEAAPTAQEAPRQSAQEPCPTCVALARTVMFDQVSFDRKPDCYGIRQITDDEGVEEWEDIRTSPDVAREEANDMMATGRGETYEVVPLYTAPQPAPVAQGDAEDAARYRCWRDAMIEDVGLQFTKAVSRALPDAVGASRRPTAHEWDAAIDAARAQAKEGTSHG